MDPLAPPVVAVVVTCDPGPWFEEGLSALACQDYPSLSVLVVDAASAVDPTPRVASVLPTAFVRRLPANAGFAATANEAMKAVEGASHLVFCHDDVAPEPDALRLMVEEGFRSNAGVVTPKLVAWDDPLRLLQVGMGADKVGAPSSRVEPRELDQEQHDAVRDVFVAPGGCTLVRQDLFAALGGFDAAMFMFGEDLDFSWRAQAVGARVVVAPAARVRHLEAATAGLRPLELPESRPPTPTGPPEEFGPKDEAEAAPRAAHLAERRFRRGRQPEEGAVAVRLRRRHELRAVLKNYGTWHLLRVVPQALALSLAEAAFDLVSGRREKARAVLGAWGWNMARSREIRQARRGLRASRLLHDSEVRRLQVRGSARLSGYFRSHLVRAEPAHRVSRAEARRRMRRLADAFAPSPRARLVFWGAVAIVLAYGARHLLAEPLPVVGQLAPFPGWTTFLHQFASGWQVAGLGREASAPPVFGVLGVAGGVLLGSTAQLEKILFLGALPLGAVGAYRLGRAVPSRLAPFASALVYLAVPLPYNAMAQGHMDVLLVYAAVPWMLARLLRASRLAPFDGARRDEPDEAPEDDRASTPILGLEGLRTEWRSLGRQALILGVVVALLCAYVPAGVAVVVVMGVGLALGCVLLGDGTAGARAALVAAGSIVVAAVLCFPWSLEFLRPGAQLGSLLGVASSPAQALGFGAVLRFQTGPLGSAPVGWAFLAAAFLPLLIGQRWRFSWAARLWVLAVLSWIVAWLSGRGWLGSSAPAPALLVVPAAAAVGLCVALGLTAFERDLARYRFGWRQAASVIAGAIVAVGTVPVLTSTLGGHWNLPQQGFEEALSWMPTQQSAGAFRVLWVADPQAMPLKGWRLASGVAYATSENGVPDVTAQWPFADPGASAGIGTAIDAAWRGDTVLLGHLLAPMAIRYVVVPSSAAPPVPGQPVLASTPVPPGLQRALVSQDDLRQLNVDPGLLVLENSAWAPQRAALSPAAQAASVTSSSRATLRTDLSGSRPILRTSPGFLSYTGAVPRGTAYLAASASDRWEMTDASGRSLPRYSAFGWANGYRVDAAGRLALSYSTSPLHYLGIAVEVILVALAVAALALTRRRRT